MDKFTRVEAELYMDKVLEVRYTDVELEKSLCERLMEWGSSNEDKYVMAFSHTYLGDYYISQNDTVNSALHLMEALNLAAGEGYSELLVRIYILLGVYYGMTADEQNSIQSYMEGIGAAQAVGDVISEGLILNNIAFHFQKHQGIAEAMEYCKRAYFLLKNSDENGSMATGLVLSNLASAAVLANSMEAAKSYIEELGERSTYSESIEMVYMHNRCQYYAAMGDAEQAKYWADLILEKEKNPNSDKLNAFEVYAALVNSMLQLKEETYAKVFLGLTEKYCATEAIDQLKQLEGLYMKINLAFEKDEAKLNEGYKRYCLRTIELNESNNKVITNGLKTAIKLSQVAMKKKELETVTKNLKMQMDLDELTKVYTRRYFERLINSYNSSLDTRAKGFIMLDMDCLKEYNDNYGHVKGDGALIKVGECLLAHTIEGIYPCRFGGDEFVCFCVGVSSEAMEKYINSVREDLHKRNIPHCSSHCADKVTLSIGYVVEDTKSEMSCHSLLELADKALYDSKMNGRNTYSRRFI